jgi:glutamate-ammonia-ligase adenylyltransferase
MHSNEVLLTGESDALAGHSRLVQRLRRRYAAELALLPDGPPVQATMAAAYAALRAIHSDSGTALRILRQLVMERLVRLDCDEQAPLATITRAVTELAEFALDIACNQALRELDAVHGAPRWAPAASGPSCGWWAWASWARASSTCPATSI